MSFRLLVAMKSLVTYSIQSCKNKLRRAAEEPLVQKAIQHHAGKPPSCPPRQNIWQRCKSSGDLKIIRYVSLLDLKISNQSKPPLDLTRQGHRRPPCVESPGFAQSGESENWLQSVKYQKDRNIQVWYGSDHQMSFAHAYENTVLTWSRVLMSGERPPCTQRTCPSISAATVSRSNTWNIDPQYCHL